MPSLADLSAWQRIQFGHAALQVIAKRHGVDLLHIKGPALAAELAPTPRRSTDADILVRPGHLDRFITALHQHDWELVADFPEGSPFEHAATFWHTEWGYVDVHRRFPGLPGDADTFDRLWRKRTTIDIAGQPCPAPSITAQRLILMLHAARKDSRHASTDLRLAWYDADAETQAAVRSLATELGARIGFDAAIGRLDDHRGAPEWRLWTAFTGRESRWAEWRARYLLARNWRGRLHIAFRFVQVNRAHLAIELGRPPTRQDLAKAYVRRIRRGAQDLARGLRRVGAPWRR